MSIWLLFRAYSQLIMLPTMNDNEAPFYDEQDIGMWVSKDIKEMIL